MNNHPYIHNGKLHTAYALFFRTFGKEAPEQILEELGLTQYHHLSSDNRSGKCITAADDGEWLHICDDYSYDYWYDPEVLLATRRVANRYDTLMLTFPDIDNFYEIEYWQGGTIRRRIHKEDAPFGIGSFGFMFGRIGKKLPGESLIKYRKDPCDGLWKVAESLGISTDYETMELQIFVDNSPHKANHYSIIQARHGRGIIH
ncbi:MAG: hypothetical protein AAGB26_12655 [Planctomycetota bacterium]